jgi:opacity protein-like surface antigen
MKNLHRENEMKKKVLLAALIFLTSFAARAEDITNPFYQPLKGKGFSQTTAEYTHTKYSGLRDHNSVDTGFYMEELQFGATDRFTLIGALGNYSYGSGDKDDVVWGVGGMYAFSFENQPELLVRAAVKYMQYKGARRSIDFFAQVGYDAGATFLPYAELRVETPVGQGKDANESVIGLRVAGYSMIKEIVGVRAGLDYTYNHEDGNDQSYRLFAEADYVLTPRMSVGGSVSYLLHDSYKWDAGIDSDSFSIGANLKIAF